MTRFFKVFLITGLCVAALLLEISFRNDKTEHNSSSTASGSLPSLSGDFDDYHQSNELIPPYELSKNG
jgi:hypothetical protein